MIFYMEFLDKYKEVNNSFKDKCIFKIGESQGFFSELNNMIFTILYCLENKMQFILTSVNANFAPKNGWEEFFLPFCEQNYDKIHTKGHNVRLKGDIQKSIRRKFIVFWYKLFKNTKLTQDIFNKVSPDYYNRYINIPELNLKGQTYDIAKPIAEMVWRFNLKTKTEIDKIMKDLNLPDKYIGMQLRRGDKKTIEQRLEANPDEFMKKLPKLSNIKDILILCDDYNDLKYLQDNYPDYKFYSICKETDHGYVNTDFQNLSWEKRYKKTLELLAIIDAMLKAELFLGSAIANPQLFVKMIIGKEKFFLIEEN